MNRPIEIMQLIGNYAGDANWVLKFQWNEGKLGDILVCERNPCSHEIHCCKLSKYRAPYILEEDDWVPLRFRDTLGLSHHEEFRLKSFDFELDWYAPFENVIQRWREDYFEIEDYDLYESRYAKPYRV